MWFKNKISTYVDGRMEEWNEKGWTVLWGRVWLSYRSRRRKRVLTKADCMSMGLLAVVPGKRIDALICQRNCQGCECRSPSPDSFHFPSHLHPTHNPPRCCCVAGVFYSQRFYCCRRSCCIGCSRSPETSRLLARDCRLVRSFRDRGPRTVGLPCRLSWCWWCWCCHLMAEWNLWRPCWERGEDERREGLGRQQVNVEKQWEWEMSKEEREGCGRRRICAWWERRKEREKKKKKKEKRKKLKCRYLGCIWDEDEKDSRKVLEVI